MTVIEAVRPTTLQETRDKRAGIWEQMKALLASAESESRDLSAEEASQYDALEADLDKLGEEIRSAEAADERRKRHEQRTREFSQVVRDPAVVAPDDETAPADESYERAFRAFLRDGINGVDVEARKILREGFVPGAELRAQGVATGAAGGYLVPPAFRNKLQEAMKFFASMRQVAEVIETETGATLPWPTADDTANKGAILAENTQVTEQDVTIGQMQLGAYMYTSKLVRVSFQLLQDNGFNLESWLARKLGERIGRIQNEHFTTGTGTGQPEGVQTNATIGKTGANGQTTSVTYDDLVDLIHSVDIAYRQSGRFMLNDLTVAAARKLKDTQGRPLWEPSIQVGSPDRLLGYGLTVTTTCR